jgi:uncharacterized protein (TIGR02391 family)
VTRSPFEMQFDPRTVKHLGVSMYSKLPPAVAELVSNAYDADAENVTIRLSEQDGVPRQIQVVDDGVGLSLGELNTKFLVIGRDRRAAGGDVPSHRLGRLPIGKKGLGKLALFGLAKTITVASRQNGKANALILDWDELCLAEGVYRPTPGGIEVDTTLGDGTTITLSNLKRKSPFDADGLADSLSQMFIIDDTFKLTVESPSGRLIQVDDSRRYGTITREFEWDLIADGLVAPDSPYAGRVAGELITSDKPIRPSSGLRGIALYSRGKLVNAPEFFSVSTSSHFYQYLTGRITVDYIDLLDEDVISTNRQSINWEHPEMVELREFLAGLVARVDAEWRVKRSERKRVDFTAATGIDAAAWMKTLSPEVRADAQRIIGALGGEDALESFTPVIEALHNIVPEYPELHWRHLHPTLKAGVEKYYRAGMYGDAAAQGVQIYCEEVRRLTGEIADGADLVNRVFGSKKDLDTKPPKIQLNALSTDSEKNIQEGQGHLSRGVVTGFRNPISHTTVDAAVPAVFSELDCLNILSTVSYLLTRLDGATVNELKEVP